MLGCGAGSCERLAGQYLEVMVLGCGAFGCNAGSCERLAGQYLEVMVLGCGAGSYEGLAGLLLSPPGLLHLLLQQPVLLLLAPHLA